MSAVFWGEGHTDMDQIGSGRVGSGRVGSGRIGSDRGGAAPAFFDEFSYYLGPDGAPIARRVSARLSCLSEQLLFFEVPPFFNSRERDR